MQEQVVTINGKPVIVPPHELRFHDWLTIANIIITEKPQYLYVGMRHTWNSTQIPLFIDGYILESPPNIHIQPYSYIDEPVAFFDNKCIPCWTTLRDGQARTLQHAFEIMGIDITNLIKGKLPEECTARHRPYSSFMLDGKKWPIAKRSTRYFDWKQAEYLIKQNKPRTAKAVLIHDTRLDDRVEIYEDGHPIVYAPYNRLLPLFSIKDIPAIVFDDLHFFECWSYSMPTNEPILTWPDSLLSRFKNPVIIRNAALEENEPA